MSNHGGNPKYALVSFKGRTSTSAWVRLAIQRRQNGAFCEKPGNLLFKACTSCGRLMCPSVRQRGADTA